MKKTHNVIMTAVFCVIFICSCSISHEVTVASGKEENGLLEGLQLNDPKDIAVAAERILKMNPNNDGKEIDSNFNITDYHCEAGILISACQLLKYRERDEDQNISDVIDSVNNHLQSYALWDSEVFCSDRKEDLATVVTNFQGMAGMSHVCPTIICYTIDGGSSWDYYYTNDEVTEYIYTEDGCFAYLSEFSVDYSVPSSNKLVFCDTFDGEINYIDIGFDRRGLSFCEEEIIDTDILSIEDTGDADGRRKLISIGYRVNRESEDEPYFCTVRFPNNTFDNIFDSYGTEILSIDKEFMWRFWIVLQGEEGKVREPVFYTFTVVDFVFPDSNSRYLNKEEIEEWKTFVDRLGVHDYFLDLLERAKNEIYARRGFDFSKTGYKLFNETLWYRSVAKREVDRDDLNEFERYNSDLIEALLKVEEKKD